jgi:putative molybdopterin biosynthesis protein
MLTKFEKDLKIYFKVWIIMSAHTDRLQELKTLAQIKTVADSKRFEILRYLMTRPSTVSQIGRQLGVYPAGVRYHIKKLEDADLVELNELRVSPGFTEKYYSAKANALMIHKTILPLSDRKSIIFMGSHDLAWEQIIRSFCDLHPKVKIFNFPVGSLDGLIALRQGSCQLAGSHLLDSDTQQFNHPYVKHFFPGQATQLITLAKRVQGLLFAKGNPMGIKSLDDLTRKEIKFVNRNAGSGTRIWLDNQLQENHIPSENINGYMKEMNSHTAVAQEIMLGQADAAIGLIAAGNVHHLDSIPLFEEQYDLIVPNSSIENQEIIAILDYLSTYDIRKTIGNLPGYDAQQTGDCLEVR